MPDKVVIRLISKKSQEQNKEPPARRVVVYRWDRILGALVVLIVLLVGLVWGGKRIFEKPEIENQEVTEQARNTREQTTIAHDQQRIQEQAKKEEPPGKPAIAHASPMQTQPPAPTVSPRIEASATAKTPPKETGKPAEPGTTAPPAGTTSNTTLTILSDSIKRAQLTSNVVNGEPIDSVGPDIPMNERGLVKVYLFMETSGLKGKTLYHDWYWKGKRIAHARIPVKRKDQSVASSKFIDRIMVGFWEVKVVDEKGNLMAKTGFEVR